MPSVRSIAIFTAVACLFTGVASPVAHAQVSAEVVSGAVDGMKSGDREKVMAGRVSLLSVLNGVRQNPALLATFAKDINTALLPIAAGNDPHAKLNAALVVQRIADQGTKAEVDIAPLGEITVKLVGDSSPAVAVYGLRAASSVLPRQLADPKQPAMGPLAKAVVASVTAHPQSESIAAESYAAVVRVLNDRTAVEALTANGLAIATPRAVDIVQQLLAARITQFGAGTLPEPSAELAAISFLGKSGTYNVSTPAQRIATVRSLLQLMDAASNEMLAVPPAARQRVNDLRNVVKGAGGSLSVISQLSNKPELQAAAQKTQALGLATPINEYRQVATSVAEDFYRLMPESRATTQPATTAPAK